MKNIFVLVLSIITTAIFAQQPASPAKVMPQMYSGIIPGIPADINLPGLNRQILATPLDLSEGFVSLPNGVSAACFLTSDTTVVKRFKKAASKDSIIVLYGLRIDPLTEWSEDAYKNLSNMMSKAGFLNLKSYIWLSLTSFKILPPDMPFSQINSTTASTGNHIPVWKKPDEAKGTSGGNNSGKKPAVDAQGDKIP